MRAFKVLERLLVFKLKLKYCIAGKIKEAEAIEQNMRAKGGSVPPAGYAPQVSPVTKQCSAQCA
jgi:hypothetical protein